MTGLRSYPQKNLKNSHYSLNNRWIHIAVAIKSAIEKRSFRAKTPVNFSCTPFTSDSLVLAWLIIF